MEQIVLIVHVLAALGVIGLIMIQQGKGADMGASFGAGASQTLLGSSGSGNVLTKTTALLATTFFLTSFGLAVIAKNNADLSGGLDIDIPAVVELDAARQQSPPVEQGDIPTMDAVEEALSLPAVDAATSESDIPESAADIAQ